MYREGFDAVSKVYEVLEYEQAREPFGFL